MEKVLLVDDELEICLLLSGMLQREGFNTDYVLTINEAKRRLATESFNLVFLDLNLPDGQGTQLISTIRSKMEKVKIIVVSAYDGEGKKIIEQGADYFLAKPFTKNKVMIALKKLGIGN